METDNLKDYTPCYGFWLHGADPKLADCYFDITNYHSYPVPLDSPERCVDFSNKGSFVYPETVMLKCVNTKKYGDAFDSLVNDYRRYVGNKYPSQWKNLRPLRYLTPKRSYGLPKEVLQKRLFFIYIAKLVINGSDTAGGIAHRYGLNKVNVEIWVAMYLRYGEEAFLHPDTKFTPKNENEIVEYQRTTKATVAETCVHFYIFSCARLRHIKRRVRRRLLKKS